ncbi:MAG TPA: serine/threonine-protein kinase [Labilithrix sp.]|nr:serine/threonine-protein kinase [Labilithrix sp.]
MAPIDPQLPLEIFVRESSRSASVTSRSGRRGRSSRGPGLLDVGSIVDKYRIEELLGTGGFAAVYRATHMLLDMPVAIKHLRPEVLARHPEVAADLLEEARLAARIHHPSVVRIYDVAQTPTLSYIVMEFIDGETLGRAIERRRRLPVDEVVRIGLDIAAGLDAARERGLVHRDVKPANILLSRSGAACIVDLGLARVASVPASADRARGAVVGTRGYVSPEQLRDPSRVDFRADMYSLGVTLREALKGRGTNAERPLPSSAQPLMSVLSRMVAPAPEDRPRTYQDVIVALREAGRLHGEVEHGA